MLCSFDGEGGECGEEFGEVPEFDMGRRASREFFNAEDRSSVHRTVPVLVRK
jgi:hypothetical protein